MPDGLTQSICRMARTAEIAECEKDALDAIITYLYDLAQERADAEDSSNRL